MTSSSQVLLALDKSWFAFVMIYLADDLPTQSLAHLASENEKFLAQKENLLIWDIGMALFLSSGTCKLQVMLKPTVIKWRLQTVCPINIFWLCHALEILDFEPLNYHHSPIRILSDLSGLAMDIYWYCPVIGVLGGAS